MESRRFHEEFWDREGIGAMSLGLAFGLYRHYVQMRQLQLGREGFLAQQSQYFDRITGFTRSSSC